jgi:hypothetical protein
LQFPQLPQFQSPSLPPPPPEPEPPDGEPALAPPPPDIAVLRGWGGEGNLDVRERRFEILRKEDPGGERGRYIQLRPLEGYVYV